MWAIIIVMICRDRPNVEENREASNILQELVNEVLDMSKLESGEIYLEEKPFDIYQKVISEVVDVVGKMADEREIKVEYKTPEIIHKDLIGSPIHLKRLLMNILSNAVKYNKDYGKIYLSAAGRFLLNRTKL